MFSGFGFWRKSLSEKTAKKTWNRIKKRLQTQNQVNRSLHGSVCSHFVNFMPALARRPCDYARWSKASCSDKLWTGSLSKTRGGIVCCTTRRDNILNLWPSNVCYFFLYRMKDFVARSHSSLLPSCAYDSKSRRTCRNSSTRRDDLSRQRSHTNAPHTNVARRLAWPNDCRWARLLVRRLPHRLGGSTRLLAVPTTAVGCTVWCCGV